MVKTTSSREILRGAVPPEKAILLGVRFTLNLLGIKDGLLRRFVEQEFQIWIQRTKAELAQSTSDPQVRRTQFALVKKRRR